MIRSRAAWLGGFLLVAMAVSPTRAADLDKYVPEDTESIVVLNVKQLLDSPLLKKFGLEHAKEALKSADQVQEVLKDLGFDPFRDLDRIAITSPGGTADDKGLIIVSGKFDADKFKARAEAAKKDNPDSLKIHTSGGHAIYEVKVPTEAQEVTLFIAVAGKDRILASPGKDYVVDALKREKEKKNPGLKNKAIQGMIEKMSPLQSLSLAAVGEAFAGADLPGGFKELAGKVDAISGGITIADDIKLELAITAKNADDAKSIDKQINDNLNTALGGLLLLAGSQKELAPLVDLVKSIKSTAKDKAVTITASVNAATIEKALDKKEF